MSILSFFKQHFFFVILILLLLLTAGAGYARFLVHHDYLVAFEGDCDPATESCYEDCEDEECTEMYYYTIIEWEASELLQQCGTDNVTECDIAYECPLDADYCSIINCDPEIDGDDTCVTN